ncbi:hypothetical protein A1OO_12315 [Enterovibrio norvegicus FF-33]|uniref:PqqD family protein n=1 Tax=Enterovibrio norvegicus FF-454 TaxID=1185651 RepID=A0A1E5C8G4_9GAMM|nr:hypothetical protein [Enterovibrio norvegicus]OEE61755.1 hypothetical protein A1OK_08330 [Enterovibrio norvegicus FF-454]OEE66552.1 hypothetical protein A1OO_12315 [Enterovibrio norvegicus FF-33]OEE75442.1 hypothetical protein A1OQ_22800 [Enterovibrio norvegicus FF-162]
MKVAELVDSNLVLKAEVDVCIADNFSLDICSYESGDQLVIFSPNTEDVLICDSATSVFLSLIEKNLPLGAALSALSVCEPEYAKRLLHELERMEIIKLNGVR